MDRAIEIPKDFAGWEQIVEALLNNDGIEAITNAISKALGNPCLVADSRYKVVALSQATDIDDPIWNSVRELGFLELDTILHLTDLGVAQRVVLDAGVQETSFAESRFPWLSIAFGLDETHVSYLTMIQSDHSATETERRGFAFAAKVVACELRKARYNKEGYLSGIEHYLHDAVRGQFASESEMQDAAVSCRFTAKPEYQIIVVRNSQGETAIRDVIRFEIEQILDTPYSIVEGSDLAFLVSRATRDDLPGKRRRQLNRMLDEHGLRGGISMRFASMMLAQRAFREALLTVDLATRLNIEAPSLRFDDARIYPFSGFMAGRYDLETFIHPALKTVMDYDRENKAELVETLSRYMHNNCNISATAKQMFLHRNTIDWRLKRIETLIGEKLSDPNLSTALWLSLQAQALTRQDANAR